MLCTIRVFARSLLVEEVIKHHDVKESNKCLVSQTQERDKKIFPLSYTPTYWGSMLKTMEELIKKTEYESASVSSGYVELIATIRTITSHISSRA